MTTIITQAGEYWHSLRSDCRNTMTYAHTTSGTLLTFYVSLDSPKIPALETVESVELILL